MHMPPVHTKPALHVAPAQHGWLEPPHDDVETQVAPEHTRPVEHLLPLQQDCPTPPHAGAWQVVPEQTRPAAQAVPQHGCPAAPHALHVAALHAKPELQLEPVQQG